MEDFLLSPKQVHALIKRLDEIKQDVTTLKGQSGIDSAYIDTPDLMALYHVSERTAFRWRSSGRVPFIKIGKKIYYRLDDIIKKFSVLPPTEGDAEDPSTEVPKTPDEDLQTGCERCPLFVILNA